MSQAAQRADLLTLTQWLSPSFPVGSFAYSHGLEQAVVAGDVVDAGTFETWLSDTLHFGAGRIDATLLAAAHRGEEVAHLARALAPSRERWHETEAQGRAFCDTISAMTGNKMAALPYPVAVGIAARDLSLTTGDVAALWLHAFASNLVSVAVRFVPLGQTQGQAILARLTPQIVKVAEAAAQAHTDDIAGFVPRGDLMAMAHETLEVRIFRT